jgi:hypothetical protein
MHNYTFPEKMYMHESYNFLARPKKKCFYDKAGLSDAMLTQDAEMIFVMLIVYFDKF